MELAMDKMIMINENTGYAAWVGFYVIASARLPF